MPVKSLKSMASKSNKSLVDLERYWREAKKSVPSDVDDKWAYVMGIVKKRAGLSEVWDMFPAEHWNKIFEKVITEQKPSVCHMCGSTSIIWDDVFGWKCGDCGAVVEPIEEASYPDDNPDDPRNALNVSWWTVAENNGEWAVVWANDEYDAIERFTADPIWSGNPCIASPATPADMAEAKKYDVIIEQGPMAGPQRGSAKRDDNDKDDIPWPEEKRWADDWEEDDWEEYDECSAPQKKKKKVIKENLRKLIGNHEEQLVMAINFAKDKPGYGHQGRQYFDGDNKNLFKWLNTELLPNYGFPNVLQLSTGGKIYITYNHVNYPAADNILVPGLSETKFYTKQDALRRKIALVEAGQNAAILHFEGDKHIVVNETRVDIPIQAIGNIMAALRDAPAVYREKGAKYYNGLNNEKLFKLLDQWAPNDKQSIIDLAGSGWISVSRSSWAKYPLNAMWHVAGGFTFENLDERSIPEYRPATGVFTSDPPARVTVESWKTTHIRCNKCGYETEYIASGEGEDCEECGAVGSMVSESLNEQRLNEAGPRAVLGQIQRAAGVTAPITKPVGLSGPKKMAETYLKPYGRAKKAAEAWLQNNGYEEKDPGDYNYQSGMGITVWVNNENIIRLSKGQSGHLNILAYSAGREKFRGAYYDHDEKSGVTLSENYYEGFKCPNCGNEDIAGMGAFPSSKRDDLTVCLVCGITSTQAEWEKAGMHAAKLTRKAIRRTK